MSAIKVSKSSTRLVEEFDAAAQSHGWARDQATGKEVDNAAAEWQESKARLLRRISLLERTIVRLEGPKA